MAAPRYFGRYEVVQELGRGGMAVVYLAMDTQVKRLVAIKVLAQHLLADQSLATRFEREAGAIATLEHSAIVPLYDHGQEVGQRYLVFRYMEGGSLADRLARDGRIPLATAVQIAERIGSALTYAHGRGIVHRDVKPGNVLFDSNGEPWLCDFGIASLSEGASTLTAGASIGTPLYISPEQALGRHATAASDTYSLGVMLFEALTGYPPFTAEHPGGLLQQHAYSQPPDAASFAPDLSVGVSNVLARALAKSPEDRWETPLALARTLARASHAVTTTRPPGSLHPPVQIAPSPPRPPTVRRSRLSPWLVGALAAVVIGAAIGGAVGVARRSGEGSSSVASSTSGGPAAQPSDAAGSTLGDGTVSPSRTTSVRVAFTDPFDFCEHVDTIDWPVKNHPGGEAYVGDSSPFSNSASNPVVWRCWAGIVLGCYAGASGGPCLKVDSRTEPWPELIDWCRAHPNEPPPYAVTGHNNAYEWGCDGPTPRITRTIIPGESIDGLHYAIGPWFEIKR